MYIADLHIHSKYSMATSRVCDAPHLDLWARYKGIALVGTGDFTHHAWRRELEGSLEEAEPGLYALRESERLQDGPAGAGLRPRFVISGEISCIYKRAGKTRKVHNLILLPGLEAAETLSRRLGAIGNIHSDGRPILGLDSEDLLEITLDCCPEAIFIPAHIWTPHFSVLGAFSGFSSMEECFGKLSSHIRALETGLSADPAMIWRVSGLDGYNLISNSDAHSPAKLGREANLMDGPLSYAGLSHTLSTGEGLLGTVEFFPEEGKYHLDGHRACGVRLTPQETIALGGRCPVCGRKLTIGVEHRVEALADRPMGFVPPKAKPFESLAPLPEVVAASLGLAPASKKTEAAYFALLHALGPEFYILREAPLSDIAQAGGPALAEGIRRLRAGEVMREAGYDGEYGVISLFAAGELEALRGQTALIDLAAPGLKKKAKQAPAPKAEKIPAQEAQKEAAAPFGLNPAQKRAAQAGERAVAVIAGPGTGKTGTLVARILWLIQERGVRPGEITAVTFTNAAAKELRGRIEAALGGKRAAKGLTIGTFHAICLDMLPAKPLLGRGEALALLREIMAARGDKEPPAKALQAIGRVKAGLSPEEAGADPALLGAYAEALQAHNARDLDDLLLEALEMDVSNQRRFNYLLVDEFQDINAVQRQLVRHWGANGQSLFVIGDPDQSIYGFRGASAACFDALRAEIPELVTLTLDENYRSTPEILQAAEALISHNGGGPRGLRPHCPPGAAVRLLKGDSPFSEAVWIAKEIGRLTGGVDMLAAGAPPPANNIPGACEGSVPCEGARAFSEMAVLCRTHRQLDLIESCLRHDGIPCLVLGRGGYLEDDKVWGALAFFTSLSAAPPVDTQALCAALELVWACPKDLREKAVRAAASMETLDPAALRQSLGGFGHLALWLDEAEAYLPRLAKEKPRRLLEVWAEAHGGGEAMERLLNAAAFHDRMADFLQTLILGQEGDIPRASGKSYASGAVRLMTLHGAKGLEFPVVFLAGLHQGALPLEREGPETDLAEERRLLYVGMTRAREELILTGGGEASPFAAELPIKAVSLPSRGRQAEQIRLF
ncbi:MAG: UvrD-helicase domain-containing protein [Candidatus Pelethousia sp.]|nr:UvrD-helicase domain-containing protein [Candidatus Pelethousia sp.]